MENDPRHQALIDNYKVVCLCKNIKKGTILKAINNGSRSLKEINAKLGSASGDCKGERCQKPIMEILRSFKDK